MRFCVLFVSEGQKEGVYQRVLVRHEEESRRKAQAVDYGVNQSWTAVYQSFARRMFSYLDISEAFSVSIKELKEQVLSPNEPSVTMGHIARQATSERTQAIVPYLRQTRSKRDLSRQYGEMGGAI